MPRSLWGIRDMKKDRIQLSDHFTCGRLLRFTLPPIMMMIFTSIYGVVDGFFVSNFVNKEAFTAVNFVMPVVMMLGGFGFMFGTGGSALIAKTLGEGEEEEANRLFSMLIAFSAVCGVAVAGIGWAVIRPVVGLLGAEGELLENSVLYARVVILGIPALFLQYEFQSLMVTAEKPKLGLWVTVAAGVTNMVLDALFVAVFQWGIVGAAAATVVSQCIGGLLPVIYFFRKNNSRLHFMKPVFSGRALLRICTNGSSELMSNIAMSLVSMLYNAQLLRYAQENGVAAYGVLMYVSMIFVAVFIGFSVGTAPVISFHFGAQNHGELKSILRKSLGIISLFSVCMFALALGLAKPLSLLFVGYDAELMEMTLHAFFIFSFSFFFSGFAIYGSSFFTALNDGVTSAIISFLRTLVFQIVAVLIFPLIWELDGIWFSIVAAEAMAVAVTAVFLLAKRKKYQY